MSKDEALSLEQTLRLAFEAMKIKQEVTMWANDGDRAKFNKAIKAVEAALEAKDEPVAFFDWYDNAHWGNEDFKEGCHRAWNAAIKYTAKPNQEAKDERVVNTDHVICPNCVHQFRAIPQNVQKLILASGFEPPFTTPPQRKPLTDEEIRRANHHMVDGAYDYSFKQGVRWAEKVHGIKWEWEK